MTRGWIVPLVAGMMAISLQPKAQERAFRATTEAVAVDVGVYRNQALVSGLTAADFEVLDSGVPQAIIDVSREALPVEATLVVDVSQSVLSSLAETLLRAVHQVEASLTPADRSTLVTFDERIRGRAGANDRPGPARTASSVPRLGLTSLMDAIAASLPTQPEGGRRAMMIVFTDGVDTSSFLDEATVLELARRASPAVFVVALTPRSAGPEYDQHARFFADLTELTGGRFARLRSEAEIGPAFLDALTAFRQSYVLRYTPRGVDTRGWHDITVRVKRAGSFEIRARRGYTR